MPLLKLQFQPGINREGTEYSADAGWYNADKIRFRKGKPEKIGGWEKYSVDSFLGVCRSLEDWVAQDGVAYIGLGTTLKFYINQGDSFFDVTPIRATTTNGITFAATNGSSTITVTDDDHGASANDFVTFSGAATLGGVVTAAVLNQEYQVESITSTDVYTVIAKDTSGDTVTANGSDSGNGGSGVDGAYQISVGLDTYVQGVGWGANTWGEGTFGSVSSISSAGQLRLYSQDVFGDDLIINVRAGGVYYWDESSGATVRAVALSAVSGASGAPTIALQVMMSDVDKHVICFGVNPLGSSTIDPLHVRWSDSPFIFQFTVVNEGISMISPKAAINAGGIVFFMGRGGFYSYTGSVQPINCSVLDYVFSNLNQGQSYKVFASTNPDHNEVTWFYPIGSGNTDNTNYVTYNYAERLWTIGTMERGSWIEANSKNFPIASSVITSSDNNYLYIQERGHDDDGSAMTAFIESGDVEMGDGERYMLLSKLIPDFTFRGNEDDASMSVIVKGKDFPLEDNVTLSTSTITSSTKQAFLRARTRSSAFRIESSESGYGWRLGDLRFDMRPDGRR